MNGKQYIGNRVSSFDRLNDIGPITGIALVVDEDNEYQAGDQTGYVLEIDCPYGTQAMADNLLSSLVGKTYIGYRAEDADLDMSAELGDGVTIGGVYSMLANRVLTFGPGHMSDISAPTDGEMEHEFPYISSTQREINRRIARTESLIQKTSEEILLQVKDIEGNISKIDQRVDSITLSVSSSKGSTTFTLEADGATLSTKTLDLSVDAVNINGKLNASQLNITGAITFNDLDSSTQNYIDSASENALGAYAAAAAANDAAAEAQNIVSGWTYGSTTYIDGSMIMANTVQASTLKGGEILLLDASGKDAGTFELTGASSAPYAIQLYSTGALRFWSEFGNIYLDAESATGGTQLHLQESNIAVTCVSFYGWDEADLGRSSTPWGDVYAVNSAAETSDLNLKKDIIYGLAEYDALYDRLEPVSFLFKNGTSGRRHIGMIAQDVEATLAELGIDTKDFAGFVKSPARDEDGNIIEGEYNYALRYGEWISLNIWQIQQLKARVAELEAAVYG